MMGIVMPETCWAYKKYNKIICGIYLVVILQLSRTNKVFVGCFAVNSVAHCATRLSNLLIGSYNQTPRTIFFHSDNGSTM